jgi:hypothetical protein
MCIFLEEFDPFRQFSLAGGGGWRGEKKLDSCVLLALRQFPRLAGRGAYPGMPLCVCVCKTRRRRAMHFLKLPYPRLGGGLVRVALAPGVENNNWYHSAP